MIVFAQGVPAVFIYGKKRSVIDDSFIAVFYGIGEPWGLSDIAYAGEVKPDHAKQDGNKYNYGFQQFAFFE